MQKPSAGNFGKNRKEILEDIAIVTGATFYDVDSPMDIKDITIENLGSAKNVKISKDSTIILRGESKDDVLENKIDEIKNNPSKKVYLKKQINLLPTADICTMDSFCAKIVRENFNLAEISSDFQIIEKSDLEVLKKQCISEVLDELYENEDNYSFFICQ